MVLYVMGIRQSREVRMNSKNWNYEVIDLVELYGWLSISEKYEDEDSYSEEFLQTIMKRVKEIVSNSKFDVDLQYMNGIPFINTAFSSNHRTPQIDEIIETYKKISEIATGSYGLIYLRDDEDRIYYNAFQKYIFKRGNCSFISDTDFSPCIPEIEEESKF